MNPPALLANGDFSGAIQMSVKVLRHYHQIGLLEPTAQWQKDERPEKSSLQCRESPGFEPSVKKGGQFSADLTAPSRRPAALGWQLPLTAPSRAAPRYGTSNVCSCNLTAADLPSKAPTTPHVSILYRLVQNLRIRDGSIMELTASPPSSPARPCPSTAAQRP